MRTPDQNNDVPNNEAYENPAIVIIEMEPEGILCVSGQLPEWDEEDW